ncbi:MAG: hypothetical protein IKE63_05275 [Bacilli bacterium]|nr:hypothetical protein [Bacilli bacterium]
MYEKFIDFLKHYGLYNQEVFDFIKDKTRYVDYNKEEARDFIGCFPKMENDVVKDIRLCVPKIVDDVTVSINIHEYVHLLKIYSYLNKEYKESKYEEVLPTAYELLYLRNNDFDYLKLYKEYIMSGDDEYLKYLVTFFDSTDKILRKNK